MPQPFPYALSHSWWTWEHPAIRAALRQAFMAHWVPVVEQAFMRNRKQGHGPTDWAELVGWSQIRQDQRNIEKKAEGRYGCSEGFMLGLSTALKLPLSELYPTTEEYLQRATLALLKGRGDKASVTEYIQFRLTKEDGPTESNGHGRAPPGRERCVASLASVHQVAAALEPILAEIDGNLCDRSANHEADHERRAGQPRATPRPVGAQR